MLEQHKTPPGPSNGGIRDKRLIVEVFPVKMSATLEGHSLTLSGPDDASKLTIDLLSCTVVAVSASNLPSRKWLVRIVASLFPTFIIISSLVERRPQFFFGCRQLKI